MMMQPPTCTLVFYRHMQPAYGELVSQSPCHMQLQDGMQHFTKEVAMELGTLAIMDDMKATRVHHYGPCITHLVQNFCAMDTSHSTMSHNEPQRDLHHPIQESQGHNLGPPLRVPCTLTATVFFRTSGHFIVWA